MNSKQLRQLLLFFCILLAPGVLAAQTSAQQTVPNFVTAFNQQNVEAMLNLASDDVDWMSVAGEIIAVEAAGSSALKTAMHDFF